MDKDYLNEVMNRYEKANYRAIVVVDAIMFKALQDIPNLVEEVERLQNEINQINPRQP